MGAGDLVLPPLHAANADPSISDDQKVQIFGLFCREIAAHDGQIVRLGYYHKPARMTYYAPELSDQHLSLGLSLSAMQDVLLAPGLPVFSVYELNQSAHRALEAFYNDTDKHLRRNQLPASSDPMHWILHTREHSLGSFYADKRNLFMYACDHVAWLLKKRHEGAQTDFHRACVAALSAVEANVEADVVHWMNDLSRSKIIKR